jgi:hypothetical protein
VSVEIFPFVIFGGIAVIAVVGIVSFRPGPGRREEAAGVDTRRRSTMTIVRDGCWVALVIAVLGTIVYLVYRV